MPPNESGSAVKLAVFSAVEVAFLLEMIVDRGMDGDEFLQVSHAAEAQHRPLFFVGLADVNSRLDCLASGQCPVFRRCQRAVIVLLRNFNVALRSRRLVK
jgi:hypothetical protein